MKIKFETIWNNFANDPPCVDKTGVIPAGYENLWIGLAALGAWIGYRSRSLTRSTGQT
jgi:hypothetical protein